MEKQQKVNTRGPGKGKMLTLKILLFVQNHTTEGGMEGEPGKLIQDKLALHSSHGHGSQSLAPELWAGRASDQFRKGSLQSAFLLGS